MSAVVDTLEVRCTRISPPGERPGTVSFNLRDMLKDGDEVRVVTTNFGCPAGGDECERRGHVHWRSGVGFDDQRRCGKHSISWEPGETLLMLVPRDR